MIEIVSDGDERVCIYTGGGTDPAFGDRDLIAIVNHDEHGWAGMDAVIRVVEEICEIYNIECHKEM